MTLDIRVAGPGCKNCKELEARVHTALEQLAAEATVTKITEYKDIAAAGVLTTPGLIINGKVAVQGRVPTVDDIKDLLAGTIRA